MLCHYCYWWWLLPCFCGWPNKKFIIIKANDVTITIFQELTTMGILVNVNPFYIRKKASTLKSLSYNGMITTTTATIYTTSTTTTISSMDVPLDGYQHQYDLIEIPTYTRNTAMCLIIGILILGIIGNMMVPIVTMRTKDMHNSTNIFLINLSIADLLVLLVCTPTVLIELNIKSEIWILGPTMCKIVPFVELTVAHASILTILAVSFERYYVICKPLKAGYICTRRRAISICFLAWLMAGVFTSPILWMAQYKHLYDLSGSICLTQVITDWTIIFFIIIIFIFFIMPLIILSVLYCVISAKLINNKRSMMRLRSTKLELNLKARNQVILMLGAVVISFFLCLLPFRLLTLWIIFSTEQDMNKMGIEIYYNLLYFCRIMLYLNSAINPILYNLMSTKFRNASYNLLYNLWNALWRKCLAYERQRKRNNFANVTITINSNTATTSTNTSSSVLSRNHMSNRPDNKNITKLWSNRFYRVP